MIRITRLRLKNYRGIKVLDTEVTGAGILAKGRNGSGKTTILNAIGSALAANDIGPDAVRIGEEDGEILIDLDASGKALHVRRRFGEAGSTLAITNEDGDRKSKPAALLQDLLGSSPLDVVGVVLEKDKKKRRERILAALPVKVTAEQLRRWVPGLSDDYDCSGHGLEVVERLRLGAYAKRTEANKAAKEAAAVAATDASAAAKARKAAPTTAPALDAAVAALDVAKGRVNALEAKQEAAARAHERTAGLRTQAEELRARASVARGAVSPSQKRIDDAQETVSTQRHIVADLRRRLAECEQDLKFAEEVVKKLDAETKYAESESARAIEFDRQAARIEEGLAAAVEEISDTMIQTARDAVIVAETERHAAVLLDEAVRAEARAIEAGKVAGLAETEAGRLDAVVKALSIEAPAAILAETPGVAAGLELDGDDVRLGGVSLDKINGAAQMRFAADIARALNPGVGFMVVDGLERLDPDQLESFVAAATEDGRQLFGSIVDRGDLVLAAIGVDQAAEAAE